MRPSGRDHGTSTSPRASGGYDSRRRTTSWNRGWSMAQTLTNARPWGTKTRRTSARALARSSPPGRWCSTATQVHASTDSERSGSEVPSASTPSTRAPPPTVPAPRDLRSVATVAASQIEDESSGRKAIDELEDFRPQGSPRSGEGLCDRLVRFADAGLRRRGHDRRIGPAEDKGHAQPPTPHRPG